MSTVNGEGKKPQKDDCFVIMPISDHPDYEKGHFARVYNHIIKPACEKAKINPVRADDVQNTNYIMIDILKRIIDAPIAVCDLSTRNPNVFYELGIRHAFNLPVVLIKDTITGRAFDVQGLRTLDYDGSLRIDSVQRDSELLYQALVATMDKKDDVNSIIQLLGVAKAEVSDTKSISGDTALILQLIDDLGHKINNVDRHLKSHRFERRVISKPLVLPNGEKVSFEDMVYLDYEEPLGKFIAFDSSRGGVILESNNGDLIVVSPNDDRYKRLSVLPF